MGAAAEVDVVVVNWNGGALLRGCLAALDADADGPRLSVTVVDNASSDRSHEGLSMARAPLRVAANRVNTGFGKACNQGAGAGSAPAILFLNPDTRVLPGAVAAALAALSSDDRVGGVGARLVDESGATQRTCARMPTAASAIARAMFLDRMLPGVFEPHFLTGWDHADLREVDQLMGAFLMVRRAAFEDLGGFDPRFHVYWEDVDLCTRIRAAGLALLHVPDAVVAHRGQGTTDRIRDIRLFYFMRSQAQYVAKHHGAGAAMALLAADLMAHVPARVAASLAAGSMSAAADAARAGWLLVRDLPGSLPGIARGRAAP